MTIKEGSLKRIKNHVEEALGCKVVQLNLKDEFRVKPNIVTEYCSQDNISIPLSPYELFVICDKVKISSVDFIKEYCGVISSKDDCIPYVVLGNRGCKFAVNNKCMLEKEKPNTCALFPLARIKKLEKDSLEKYLYFVPINNKDTIGAVYTLEDWLSLNDFKIRDSCLKEYTSFMLDFSNIIDFEKLRSTDEIKEDDKIYIISSFICILYSSYNPGEDMLLDYRYKSCIEFAESLVEEYPFLKKSN